MDKGKNDTHVGHQKQDNLLRKSGELIKFYSLLCASSVHLFKTKKKKQDSRLTNYEKPVFLKWHLLGAQVLSGLKVSPQIMQQLFIWSLSCARYYMINIRYTTQIAWKKAIPPFSTFGVCLWMEWVNIYLNNSLNIILIEYKKGSVS